MSDKSGIQLLEELLEQVKILNHRFNITEQNVKDLLNRSNGFGAQIQKPIVASAISTEKTAKVIGKFKTTDGKLVCGAQIKIINNNQVIKETKTNRAGEMFCFLPPGEYRAECFLQGIIDTKVSFKVGPEDKLIRLAQA